VALHKGLQNKGFKLPTCEKHFHDHDETWMIMKGKGTAYWIDPSGNREEFELEGGDVWMIPAGYEHGTDGFPDTGQNTEDFTISTFIGTMPPGSHKPGHYYVEEEGYIPSLELRKTPSRRYDPALPETMKAFVFPEKGKMTIEDVAMPECEPGMVLCESIYGGLTNGTSRNALVGGNYGRSWPARPGYQNVGKVLTVGDGVDRFKVGDLIFSGQHRKHSQYFTTPATEESFVVTLPESVDPRHAALFGVASVAMHDVRRAETKLGENVLVVGAGPVGQFTAQAARLSGAIVTICDLNEKRLAIAEELGAHQAITVTTDGESWNAIEEAGPFDVVFEDSGAPILDQVIGPDWHQGVLKHRSRVVIIAGRERVDYSFNAGQGYELCILQASHFTRDDLEQVCRLTAEGQLQIDPIIQDVVPASEADSIYNRLRDDPASLFGVVFDWT
jgi:2-desacetyl-2-hydroxyethyl bacteriochlorophyllide A dehydrogenase